MAFDDLGKGLAAVSGQKRMTDEQRAAVERVREWWNWSGPRPALGDATIGGLLVAFDALTADLERATRVEDEEVDQRVGELRELEAYFRGDDVAHIPQSAMQIRARMAADLLSRLSSALASAERERDALYNQMDAIVDYLGIAESDETPIEAIQRIEHRAEAAEAKLREAREVANVFGELLEVLRKEAPGTLLNNHRFDALGIRCNATLSKLKEAGL